MYITSRAARRLLIGGAAVALAGCMSLEQMAPPVEGLVGDPAVTRGYSAAQLTRGRDLYIGKCAKCHNIEPIGRYSLEKWHEIIPDMAEETKLTPQETQDLRAYVLVAHDFIATQPVKR